MSDEKNSGDKTLRASGSKTLSMKRQVESGKVRQNFSHGRSRPVVVEKKKRRILTPQSARSEQPSAETTPASAVVQASATPSAEKQLKSVKPAQAKASSGGSRKLTDEERDARAQALADAKVREAENRERAEREKKEQELRAQEEAKRREQEQKEAEERERQEQEKLLAEQRKQEEEAALAVAKAQKEAQKEGVKQPVQKTAPAADLRQQEEAELKSKRNKPEVRTPSKRGEERRRGRLTLTNALSIDEDGEGRERSMASMRRQRERAKKQAFQQPDPDTKRVREVVVPETITIQELANRMAERAVDIIRMLMKQGQMLKINDFIDADTAQLIVEEFGHVVKRVAESDVEEGLVREEDDESTLKSRPPIVTIMGHVDHGKTSLLDALRKTNVVSGEAGGITQHIGAYQVETETGEKVTFIDTPGHAAFTAMRARGAKVTDIVILVVAADDGVMPQTIEAINHAKAAEVPMIVAINKIDKPGCDPNRVRTDLLQHEVQVESMGGDVLEVEVSALKEMNLDKLIEAILLQSEVLEIKANPDRPAEGVAVETKLDTGRGSVATALVQHGTLNVGDIVVIGSQWGKVRALINDRGESVKSAGPSSPVEVLGLNGTPDAGDHVAVVENEARAREVHEYRKRLRRDRQSANKAVARGSLEQMMTNMKTSDLKEFPLLIKGDVQGSVEAIIGSLEKISTDEVAARIVHSGVGGITESDVTLAAASEAVILAFNVRANKQALDAANKNGIEIRYYSVIYDLIDEIKQAMSGLLAPTIKEEFIGYAEILEVFNISKIGKVAGCRISEGKVERGSGVRLLRDDVVIHEGTLGTLKRFKDEVREVVSGQECGMGFENYQDIRQGDMIECFRVEEIQRSL